MSPDIFHTLAAQGYNRIPVFAEIQADLETPLSVYLKLANAPYSFLLESVQGGSQWGRYSMIGLSANTLLQVRGHCAEVITQGQVIEQHETADPLQFVEDFKNRFHVAPVADLPRFNGGLVGYFAYDCVRYVEKRLGACPNPDPTNTPDIFLLVADVVVVFDNLAGRLYLIVLADPSETDALEKAQAQIQNLIAKLRIPLPEQPVQNTSPLTAQEPSYTTSLTQSDFEQAVRTIKDHIHAGECMQVVPSQRMSVAFDASPLDLYRALRSSNPTPYMYYFHFGDFHVVGSSPEVLARLEDSTVTVRPIAGTRPRGQTPEQDKALERELLSDAKEIAEHFMLIDSGLHDVGLIAQTGSTQVTEKMIVERYSNVMHIVSNVTGKIRAGLTAMDVLRAILPAGTLSGAPKIRAMEIIDELEPVKRGIYGGAVGYMAWNGNMDTAIAIRTAVIKDGLLHIQAGAGIVANSVPAREWEETLNKRRAMFNAIMQAQGLSRLNP